MNVISPDFDTKRVISVGRRQATVYALIFYGFSLIAMVLSRVLPKIFTVPFIVVSLSFVPGFLFLLMLQQGDITLRAEHVLYAFGSSLILLMFVGALINILLPYVGVERPLMPVPLGAGVTAAVGLLATVAVWTGNGESLTLEVPSLWSPIPLGLLLLPLLSIIGVQIINMTGVNAILLVALLAIGALPLLVVWRFDKRWHSLAIWTAALGILYHKSLWQHTGFGGRPHGITAWEAGRWSPGVRSIEPYSSELVQNGVLFPLYAKLSDLFIITQYEVVNPFLVSFIPLALYVIYRNYVESRTAFLGAALFAFVHPFYLQYPTAGRAATPVLFLSLFGVALASQRMAARSRAFLAVLFLIGIITTHYGTSYYIAGAFVIALVMLYSLWVIDGIIDGLKALIWTPEVAHDGGEASRDGHLLTRQSSLFTAATVFFFFIGAIGWYLYTRGGWKFDLLPKHIYENVMSLISSDVGGGRTAARVQESYASTSIQISKYIYFLLAFLMVLGFAVAFYRRVITRRCEFDDGYLTIAAALFGIFGTTLIVSNWGGGRPMMITFSFTAVFAIVGVLWMASIGKYMWSALHRYIPFTPNVLRNLDQAVPEELSLGQSLFASFLLVFFILNTGVGAAMLFQGFAPSNVPAETALESDQLPTSQQIVHRETDIMTHLWVIRNLDAEYTVYGDTFGARQYDWYRPDIAARTSEIGGGYTPATKPEVFNVSQQGVGRQPGYILVLGHNDELGSVWESKFLDPKPLERLGLEQRNRIYTNGESYVYFYPTATGEGKTSDDTTPSG